MQAGGGDTVLEYSALDARALLEAIYLTEGVTGPLTSLQVSQRAAGANFSVDVAAGFGVITGDDVTLQGKYLVQATAVENVPTPSPPVSGVATHRIVARVRDKLHEGTWTTYDWVLVCLADGVAEGDSEITLAIVTIASGQTSVTGANISDQRPLATTASGRSPVVATVGDLPVSGQYGDRYHISSQSPIEYVWNGSVWVMDGSAATIYKPRSADLLRNTLIVPAADPQLTCTLIAGVTYELDAVLLYTADAAIDFKTQWTVPAGGDMAGFCHCLPLAATGTSGDVTLDVVTQGSTPVGGGSGVGTVMSMHVGAKVYSGSGGTFALTWSQNTSNATDTTLKQNSYMRLRPMGT
jgi:hypothetical protein